MNRTTHIAIVTAALSVALPAGFALAQDSVDEDGPVIIQGQTQGGAEEDDGYLDGDEDQANRGQRNDRMNGQSDTDRQPAEKQTLSQQELEKWFMYTACANQFEIEAAKLAQQQAQGQDVKDLAKMIEKDHNDALEKLRQEAKDADIEIAQEPELEPVFQTKLDALKKKQGKEFDKAYVFSQDAGHRMAILEHAWAKEHVENKQVLAYVEAVLPKLQKHHEKVHKDARELARLSDEYQSDMGGNAKLASGRESNRSGEQMGSNFRFSDDPAERYYQQRAQNLNYEQQLNDMASKNAQNERVKQYAQQQNRRVEQDRQRLDREAQQAGYGDFRSSDVGTSGSQQARLGEMGQSRGSDFDREYVFESSQQSMRQGLQDQYASRSGDMQSSQGGQMASDSARRSMQANQQRQQEMQQLLILVLKPVDSQQGQNQRPGSDMGGNEMGGNDMENSGGN